MKRFYLTLGLLLSFGLSTTFGQIADLAAYVNMPDFQCLNLGDSILPPGNDIDPNQPVGAWGVINNGPDYIDSGTYVWFSSPRNQMIDSGLYFSGYPTREAAPNDPIALYSYLQVDSIKVLMDIDAHQADTTGFFINYMVKRPDFVNEQVYGFFVFQRGVGDDFNAIINIDTVRENNNAWVPIKWNCDLGVSEMLYDAALDINVYPNPVKNELNFQYGFLQNTSATVSVVDMSGRIVLTKDLGRFGFGTQDFTLNTANLAPGNYILQMSTDYVRATGKFTKQ